MASSEAAFTLNLQEVVHHGRKPTEGVDVAVQGELNGSI
jgi:hypothetical protein